MDVFSNALELAKSIIEESCKPEDIVIDMTMGNGRDTVFLSFLARHVYAFDIQEDAHQKAKVLLESLHIHNVTCIMDGHENVDLYALPEVGIIIFNLGYLPGSNKSVYTKKDTTIAAIQKGLKLLRDEGIMLLVLYPGFKGGYEESLYVENYVSSLSQKLFNVAKYSAVNQENFPPYLLAIQKRKVKR